MGADGVDEGIDGGHGANRHVPNQTSTTPTTPTLPTTHQPTTTDATDAAEATDATPKPSNPAAGDFGTSLAAASTPSGPVGTRRIPIDDPRDPKQLPAVTFLDHRLVTTEIESAQRILVTSRPEDPNGLWLASRTAGFAAASKCRLPMAAFSIRAKQPGLLIARPDVSVVDGVPSLIPSKCALGSEPAKAKRFEEEGGPSLEDIAAFIDKHSSVPVADVQALVRWVLLSYLFGHTETHAGQIVLLNRSGSWRLAPIGWMTIFPQVAGGPRYPLAKGLRVGPEWPSDHLRVDHWVRLARATGVHPKVVIAMGRELAGIAPKAVLESLCQALQTTMLRGYAADLVKGVQRRAARMKELALLAPHQGVAGIKKEPVIVPADHHEPERKTIETFYE